MDTWATIGVQGYLDAKAASHGDKDACLPGLALELASHKGYTPTPGVS